MAANTARRFDIALARGSGRSRDRSNKRDLLNDLQAETVESGHYTARMIRENAKAREAKIAQDLAANAELAAVHRLRARPDAFGAREVGRIDIIGGATNLLEPREEVLA